MTRPDLLRQDVDFIVEGRGGSVVGIEVKANSQVRTDDFKHLKALSEVCGDQFCRGIVLYTGSKVLPFGPGMFAVPVGALW